MMVDERTDVEATRGYDRSDEIRLAERLKKIAAILETAVCTEGCDKGVVMLSQDGPTHPEKCQRCKGYGQIDNGPTGETEKRICPDCFGARVIAVYDHDYFSPLGDALIAAWELASAESGGA